MKKIIAALTACLIIVSAFAGCSDPLSSSTKSESESSSAASEGKSSDKKASSISKKEYKDSFSDLRTYMKDQGFLTDEMIKKADNTKLPPVDGVDYKYGYEYIGAVKGEKYLNNGIVIELYEFKEGEKNDYVDSVRNKGTFTLFDKTTKAYLTDGDKYMMVYFDKNLKEDDTQAEPYKVRQRAIKAFEAFSPVKEAKSDTKSDTKSDSKTNKETKETKATEKD